VTRGHDDLQLELLALRELAREVVLEAHELTVPDVVVRRVVAGDHTQHPALADLGQVAGVQLRRLDRQARRRQELVDRTPQPHRVPAHRPRDHRHAVELERDAKIVAVSQHGRDEVAVRERDVVGAVRHPLEDLVDRERLGHRLEHDARVLAPERLDALPERRRSAYGNAPTDEVRDPAQVHVGRAGDDLLADEGDRRRERDASAALARRGEVAGDQVAAALDQGRQQVVEGFDADPLRFQAEAARQGLGVGALAVDGPARPGQVLRPVSPRGEQPQDARLANARQVLGGQGGGRGRADLGGVLGRIRRVHPTAGSPQRAEQQQHCAPRGEPGATPANHAEGYCAGRIPL
jgi:hypothetical protein